MSRFSPTPLVVAAALAALGALVALAAPARPDLTVSLTGSQRATSGADNKIVLRDGKLHVAWLDADGGALTARVRTLDRKSGRWSDPVSLGQGKDLHSRPTIIADHAGFLHVVIAGHHTGLQYRRSVRPNDASEWTPTETFGRSTYPLMVCGPDNTLYLVARHDADWGGADFYVRSPAGKWESRGKIVTKDRQWSGYAGYQCGLAVAPGGTLHAVFDFYEGKGVMTDRGQHVAVCYMASDDGGATWRKADGSPVTLPARPEQMDVLARDTAPRSEPMPPPMVLAQGNIVVDSKGAPHVVYVSHLDEPGRIVHATLDPKGAWRQSTITAARRGAYARLRPTSCRGALTIGPDDTLYLLLGLVPLDPRWKNAQPARGMTFSPAEQRLVWFTSRDGGRNFTLKPALDPGAAYDEPSVARAAGSNEIAPGQFPPFVYIAAATAPRDNDNDNPPGPKTRRQAPVMLVDP